MRITGNTKEVIANKLKSLLLKKDFEKVIGLFEIMHILSRSKDISFIVSDGYNAQLKHSETDRLSAVYKYVQQNFKDNISLSTIANISSLTPQSFCRLFKKRTGKSFVEYLNEARISAACKYLLDTDWSISEVAYNCGYKTVSNFNKLFKNITGLSPKMYRESAKWNVLIKLQWPFYDDKDLILSLILSRIRIAIISLFTLTKELLCKSSLQKNYSFRNKIMNNKSN